MFGDQTRDSARRAQWMRDIGTGDTVTDRDRVPVISSRYTSSACVEGGHDLAVLVVRGSVNSRLHVLQTSLQFTRFLRDRGSPDDRFIIVRGSLLYRNAS